MIVEKTLKFSARHSLAIALLLAIGTAGTASAASTQRANQLALDEHRPMRFDSTVAQSKNLPGSWNCFVDYKGKTTASGDYFFVVIDDNTKEAQLMRGL